ncbi:MAG: hypothetical protein P8129_23235 [Anaerolineae bacterium]
MRPGTASAATVSVQVASAATSGLAWLAARITIWCRPARPTGGSGGWRVSETWRCSPAARRTTGAGIETQVLGMPCTASSKNPSFGP